MGLPTLSTIKKYGAEAAKVAAIIASVLAVAAVALPGLHAPAWATAAVATAVGVVAAARKYLADLNSLK